MPAVRYDIGLTATLGAFFAAPSLHAQNFSQATANGPGLCYHARPRPSCSGFFLTNAGAYLVFGRLEYSEDIYPGLRGDWGIMSNVGARDAIGVTLFASIDPPGGFAIGPAARYRRWLKERGSIDVGLGVAVTGDQSRSGSLFGLVKVSPNPWVGIVLRPEVVRSNQPLCGNPPACSFYTGFAPHSSFRAALGLEAGDVAGLVTTPLLAGLALLVVFAGSAN